MRIALYHDLPSGGAKRAAYEFTKRLAAEHAIDVFTLTTADHSFADLRQVATSHHVYDFEPAKLFQSPFGRLNQAMRLLSLVRLRYLARRIAWDIDQCGCDVVFVHPGQWENAPFILRDCTTPTAYYCHEPHRQLYEDTPARPYADKGWFKRRVLDRVDPFLACYAAAARRADLCNTRRAGVVLVNSHYTKASVRTIYGVDAQLCYLGVDGERFYPERFEQGGFLLSVGSLTPMKGFDFLIDALAHLPHTMRRPLVIASNFQNAPERRFLSTLAHDRGVEVHFVGHVTDVALRRLYSEAALTLYAPVREPFGLVPLESMACETAVVGVREGGVPETVLHEQTGLLVERDPEQFAGAVAHLLMRPSVAQEYGRRGRSYVLEHWSWREAVDRLLGYLKVAEAGHQLRQDAPRSAVAGGTTDDGSVDRWTLRRRRARFAKNRNPYSRRS